MRLCQEPLREKGQLMVKLERKAKGHRASNYASHCGQPMCYTRYSYVTLNLILMHTNLEKLLMAYVLAAVTKPNVSPGLFPPRLCGTYKQYLDRS